MTTIRWMYGGWITILLYAEGRQENKMIIGVLSVWRALGVDLWLLCKSEWKDLYTLPSGCYHLVVCSANENS